MEVLKEVVKGRKVVQLLKDGDTYAVFYRGKNHTNMSLTEAENLFEIATKLM